MFNETSANEFPDAAAYDGLVAKAFPIFAPPDLMVFDDTQLDSLLIGREGAALELGCGYGRVMWRLHEAGRDVYGIDAARDMVNVGREYAQRKGFDPERLRPAMMQQIPSEGGFTDVFCSDGTFMMTGTVESAILVANEAYRVLAEDGRLTISLAREGEQCDRLWRWRAIVSDGSTTYTAHESRMDGPHPQTQQVLKQLDAYDRNGVHLESSRQYSMIRWWKKDEIAIMLAEIGFKDINHLPVAENGAWITTARK